MPHKSQSALLAELTKAQKLAPAGSRYIHYKDPSKHYTVIGHAILEANDEVGIIYQAEYGDHITFVRPLSSWLAELEIKGERKRRFSRQEEN